jgi:DNA-binding transcriptional regulator YhcF (GntR family)
MSGNALDAIDNFFIHSKVLKLKLMNYIIEHPLEKLPTSKEISSTYDISDITVKKLVSELAAEGYVKPNKKGGTKIVNRFSSKQRKLFAQTKEKIKEQIKILEEDGFNNQEILTCLYSAISEYSFDTTDIVYTEKDPEMLFIGAQELSERFKTKIKPVYFENIDKEVTSSKKPPKAVIVPFYCYNSIEYLSSYTKIIPMKTTHPLEYLSNSKSIAYDSNVVYVAISDRDKEGARIIKNKITNENFNLKIFKIDELIEDRQFINSIEMVVAYKWVINNNEKIFKDIPKIIAYNIFDDKEGLLMIKGFIKSNKFGG